MRQPDAEVRVEDKSAVPPSFTRRVVGLRRWSGFALIVYAAALFTGTHIPNPEVLLPSETNDKWLHFGLYFGLAFLAATRHAINKTVTWRMMLGLWGAVALLGALDEVTQMIPGINRHADLADWIADIYGAACGLLVWHIVRQAIACVMRRVD